MCDRDSNNDDNSIMIKIIITMIITIKQIDMLGDHEIQKTHPAYPNCSLRKESYKLLYFSVKAKSYILFG